MIGSYLDDQVTNLKKGVIAAGSLIGLGMIIYFIFKKRKNIASALGIGKKKTTNVNLDTPKALPPGADHDDINAEDIDDEVIEIEYDEESTDEDSDTNEIESDDSSTKE